VVNASRKKDSASTMFILDCASWSLARSTRHALA